MVGGEVIVVSRVYTALRSTSFLVWIVAGIGGVFPDIDHIPILFGYEVTIPYLWKLDVLLGLTSPDRPFGRPLHGALLIAAIILSWISLTHICRRIQSWILSKGGGMSWSEVTQK